MLNELIDKDKKVFEYWSHAAAFLPMRDYRFTLFRKRYFGRFNKGWGMWENKNRKLIKHVLERINSEGPLQSKDFEHQQKRGTWWDWKPAKHALEYLFHTGELMVKSRKNFQKVYDLPERVLPANVVTAEPTHEEHAEHMILSAIRANGIVTKNEMVYQKFYAKTAFEKAFKILLNEQQIIKIKVENLKQEYYSTNTELSKINKANELPEVAHILSPFDNLVIQRKRLNNLFNFDYAVECYIPSHKRKFGYFSLPVLYKDKFIARIDAKADRNLKKFNVISFYFEDGFEKNKKAISYVKNKIRAFAEFTGCEKALNYEILI